MTRIAAFAVLSLLASAAAASAQDAAALQQPLVINDDTVGVLRARQAGSIILPQGKPPFAAVVVMHGCSGISPSTYAWARRLASWGYAALVVDSFGPRGVKNVCGHGLDIPGGLRAKDAFAAAAYLRGRADIDPERLGLVGFSHGGRAALVTAEERSATAAGAKPFKAIIAYYPGCSRISQPLATDVQILIGDADDWTPVTLCSDLVARYAGAPAHKPLLKIYPDALHAFDTNLPERIYFGHRLAYDAAAATDSFDMTKQFFDSRLRPASAQ
jgi:dienelactone hydrolase